MSSSLLLVACDSNGPGGRADSVFHYSVMDAMRNGVYKGDLTVAQLKRHGDFGLGTFNHLDGEMVALDGEFYRVAANGSVAVVPAETKTPFSTVVKFRGDFTTSLPGGVTSDALLARLRQSLPSPNQPYAIRIPCTFFSLTVGGAEKLAPGDSTGLATLMKKRPLYTAENIRGTLVGFYHPGWLGGVDLSPFHFHFLSEDKRFAGHFVSGILASGAITAAIDAKEHLHLQLPAGRAGYKRPWQGSAASKSY